MGLSLIRRFSDSYASWRRDLPPHGERRGHPRSSGRQRCATIGSIRPRDRRRRGALMSTATRHSPAPSDPYRYGWRYVRVKHPDGTETYDQVPLTLEDVLFPEEGDFIVHSDWHLFDITYLQAVFRRWLERDPTA